ncbi:MAG: lipoprotein, partial [Bacteroidaceae bacterium]|nr:lipoprotein [Bacteroidaceae bacterium]
MKKTISLIGATLMLSSCGIYTNYHKAESVSDNLYGEEVAVDTSTASLGDLAWRNLFTDPQLQALIEKGLQNNTDLQSARLRVEQAEA